MYLWQNVKGQGRLKYLLQQTELFAHFAKGEQSTAPKKTKGRYEQLHLNIYLLVFSEWQAVIVIPEAYRA